MRIAIVGLGTAGAAMLDSLTQVLGSETNVALTLYDPTEEPWVGRVFQDDGDSVLANSPVPTMSIRHGDTAHAERWLVQHGRLDPHHPAPTFFPRPVYGRYILDHANELVDDMRGRGWRIELVKERATSLRRNGTSGYTVGTDRRRNDHDYVILCAGGSALSDPFDLGSSEGYIADPYPTRERLQAIPSDAAVGILGSGLTAVDVAVSLQAQGHAGPVSMYSRSGVLQLVRRPGPEWTPEYLTADRISDLVRSTGRLSLVDLERLFDQEVRNGGGEPRGLFPPLPLDEPRSWLRWQLGRPHDHHDLGTFIFQRSVPTPLWGQIWHLLSPQDRHQLISRSFRDVMTRCCPMPPVNAEKILAMLDTGQLRTRKGVESVQSERRGFAVQLPSATEHVEYIVNAVTPASYGVHPGVQTLVDRAIDDGLARPHDWGGLQVDRSTGAVLGRHRPGGLYALGNLTRGAFFFIFSLPGLVGRSADIAAAIHADTHRARPRTIIFPNATSAGGQSPAGHPT